MARMINRVEPVNLIVYDDGSMEIRGRFFPANFSYDMPGRFEVTSFGDDGIKFASTGMPTEATIELLVEEITRVTNSLPVEPIEIEEPAAEAVPEAEEEDPWAQRIQERLERGSKEKDIQSQVEGESPSI